MQTAGFYINKDPPVEASAVVNKTIGAAQVAADIKNNGPGGRKRIVFHIISMPFERVYKAIKLLKL